MHIVIVGDMVKIALFGHNIGRSGEALIENGDVVNGWVYGKWSHKSICFKEVCTFAI